MIRADDDPPRPLRQAWPAVLGGTAVSHERRSNIGRVLPGEGYRGRAPDQGSGSDTDAAPGRTPPWASLTVPMSDPVSPWASAMPGSRRHHAARRNNTRHMMGSLEGWILLEPAHRRCRSIRTMSDCSCTCSTTISRPSGEMSKSRTVNSGPKLVN